jgi:chaperonin GroEL (HSP60 family)
MAGKIAAVKANVVFVEKGINEPVLDHLAHLGILAIRRIVIENLEKIARAVGAKVVPNINILSTEDLGFAKLVEERKIGGKRWVFVEGCRRAKAVTIIVRGTNQDLLTEAETSIREGLCAVRNVLKKPKVVIGGGALEMEIAMRLREWAEKHDKREQLVIKGFAEALEKIPFALAENSGLKPLDAILEMRSRHSKREVGVGIDADKRQVANLDGKIYDPVSVKEQMVISAFETSSVILRVDDFVRGKELTQRELYYEQRKKGTSPECVEKMRKDYGIEHLETD